MRKAIIILLLITPIACLSQIRIAARFGIASPIGNTTANSHEGFGVPNGFSLHILGEQFLSHSWHIGLEVGVIGRDQSSKIDAYKNLVAQGDTFTFYRSFFALPLTAKLGYTIEIDKHLAAALNIGLGYKICYWGRNNPSLSTDYGFWCNNLHIEGGVTVTLDKRWIFSIHTFPIESVWFLNTEIGIKI